MIFNDTGETFTTHNKYLRNFEMLWSESNESRGQTNDIAEVLLYFMNIWHHDSQGSPKLMPFIYSYTFQYFQLLGCKAQVTHYTKSVISNQFFLDIPRMDYETQENVNIHFQPVDVDVNCGWSCSSTLSSKKMYIIDIPKTLIIYITLRNHDRHYVRDIRRHNILENTLSIPTSADGVLAKYVLKSFSCWIQNRNTDHYVSYAWNSSCELWMFYNDGNEPQYFANLSELVGIPVMMFYDFDSFVRNDQFGASPNIDFLDRIEFNEASKLIFAPIDITFDEESLLELRGVDVRRRHFKTLQPNVWLVCEIINIYMNILKNFDIDKCVTDPDRRPILFLPSQFITKLIIDDGHYNYNNVKRWTNGRTSQRNHNIFEHKFVLIPVNIDNCHWTLVAVNIEEKTIVYYDSMAGPATLNSNRFTKNILRWVSDEHMVRHNVPLNIQDWSQVVLAKHQYPQQTNNDDCGIFTLMAAECLTKGLNIDFNSGHMGFFRRRIAINILKKSAHGDF
jgi:sentrin-specific protease 1